MLALALPRAEQTWAVTGPPLPLSPRPPRGAGRVPSMPGWGQSPGAARRLQPHQQDMHPRLGCALAPPRTGALARPGGDRSAGKREDTPAEPRVSAGGRSCTWGPGGRGVAAIAAPVGPRRLEGRLNEGSDRLKRVPRETGPIEHLCRPGLDVGASSTGAPKGVPGSMPIGTGAT